MPRGVGIPKRDWTRQLMEAVSRCPEMSPSEARKSLISKQPFEENLQAIHVARDMTFLGHHHCRFYCIQQIIHFSYLNSLNITLATLRSYVLPRFPKGSPWRPIFTKNQEVLWNYIDGPDPCGNLSKLDLLSSSAQSYHPL